MIDTVVFELHDLRKHKVFAEEIERRFKVFYKESHAVEKQRKFIDPKVYPTTVELMSTDAWRSFIKYYDSDKTEFQMVWGKMPVYDAKLASSHYSIASCIDYDNDCIRFNFSIPKYIYGTNIFLFADSPFDVDFVHTIGDDLQKKLEDSYYRLKKFITFFFEYEFKNIAMEKLYVGVDMADVQFKRVDFCFNQVFDTKQDALDYINDLKFYRKKYARDTTKQPIYGTAVSTVTEDYTWKVYHKGSEYRKNDRQKHRRINAAFHDSKALPRGMKVSNDKGLFDVNLLQDFADRIVRYELEVRTGLMNSLFKQHVFRKRCDRWQRYLTFYKKTKLEIDKGTKVERYSERLRQNVELAYFQTLSKADKKLYQYVDKLMYTRSKFFFESHPSDSRWNTETDLNREEIALHLNKDAFKYNANAKYNKMLHKEMANKFCQFVNEHQLERQLMGSEIIEKAVKHNADILALRKRYKGNARLLKEIPSKLSMSKVRLLSTLLSNHSLQELKDLGLYDSRRTYYNHRKTLATLGVHEQSIASKNYNVDLTFDKYYFFLLTNKMDIYYRKFNFKKYGV